MKNKVIVIDFESAGRVVSKNGFTEVGAILGDVETGEVLATFQSFASMKGFEWDSDCVESFWKKNPEQYQRTLENIGNADPPEVVIERLLKWIQEVTQNCRDHVFILGDNVTFDMGFITYFAKTSIFYVFGEYREIVNFPDVNMGVSRKRICLDTMNETSVDLASDALGIEKNKQQKVDHQPVNDAIQIFKNFCRLENAKQS